MRKAIFIFVAILVVAASVDWIRACKAERSDVEQFQRRLTFANMYECQSPHRDFAIRVPSFFSPQSDSLQGDGRLRYAYFDKWATVVLEAYVLANPGMTVKEGMDSLSDVLHATSRKRGSNYFILSGQQYEEGSRINAYSYYSKFIYGGNRWYVLTMLYPNHYRPALDRLFREIDQWQIWPRRQLQLKQGEEQTPKAYPEEPSE